jgi:hypothetical protein
VLNADVDDGVAKANVCIAELESRFAAIDAVEVVLGAIAAKLRATLPKVEDVVPLAIAYP